MIMRRLILALLFCAMPATASAASYSFTWNGGNGYRVEGIFSISSGLAYAEFINELDEVVVRPYNLSGDLSRDMNSITKEKVYVASTLGLPNAYVKPITQAARKLNEATTGGGLVPLNPIINAISGRTKYLKKVLATQEKYARTVRVREYYADSLFVKHLNIPENKIDDFMYFCEVDTAFASVVDSHDKLKIWEYLKLRSNAYRQGADDD